MLNSYKFTEDAAADYDFFLRNDPRLAKKVSELVQDILKHPTQGLGKPEQLRYKYAGYWSRRVSIEHRLVYKIENDTLIVISCRYHYK